MNSKENMTNNKKLALFVNEYLLLPYLRDQTRRKPRPIFIRGNGSGTEGKEGSKQAISYNHDDHNRHWVVRLALSLCRVRLDKGRHEAGSQHDAELK